MCDEGRVGRVGEDTTTRLIARGSTLWKRLGNKEETEQRVRRGRKKGRQEKGREEKERRGGERRFGVYLSAKEFGDLLLENH